MELELKVYMLLTTFPEAEERFNHMQTIDGQLCYPGDGIVVHFVGVVICQIEKMSAIFGIACLTDFVTIVLCSRCNFERDWRNGFIAME